MNDSVLCERELFLTFYGFFLLISLLFEELIFAIDFGEGRDSLDEAH